MSRASPVVAVLLDRYVGDARVVADEVAAAVRRAGYGALTVAGRELAADYRADREAWTWNAIYRLVERGDLAGVVCLSEGLGRDVDVVRLSAFLARFEPPTVSVGVELEGTDCVLVDERRGAVELAAHLFDDSRRTRAAFLGGGPNDHRAAHRQQLFREATCRSGSLVDEALFTHGGSSAADACRATRALIDSGRSFDALVAANDATAVGAARALAASALRVPDDVTLCGFGDGREAPVTSGRFAFVRQPLADTAACAARLLLERIASAGERPPGQGGGIARVHAELVAGAPSDGVACLERERRARALQAERNDAQLAIGAGVDLEAVFAAIERWLALAKVTRCFLVRHEWPYPMPQGTGELIHVWRRGTAERPAPEPFPTRDLLPPAFRDELADAHLVLVPVCADLDHYGYLLVDPAGLEDVSLEGVARSLSGALRGQHLVGCLRDQAELLQRTNADLRQSADHDPLTGLPNRRRFQERLRRLCEANEADAEATLLFIDLDGFKLVNDTLGHDAGDELLREVARRLQTVTEAARAVGGLVARLGGDEYVVLMTHGREHDAAADARAILGALAAPYMLGGERIVVSASIGGARYPRDGRDAELLLKQADRAMYQAKHGGKNGIAFYSPELGIADGHTLRLLQDMRGALPNGDLQMHFQPRVALASGRIVGAEALMRWLVDTPDGPRTRSTPAEFIPLAERTGFVTELDRFALEEACRHARRWADDGHELVVSVNVSTNMLRQRGLLELVGSAIERHGVRPERLELEITESGVMADVDEGAATLRALRELGVRLAIDDFGKGQSSLGYLARLPVDTLKIDSSFLEPMIDGEPPPDSCTAIMHAVVALGRSLHLELVAEGVENTVQQSFVERAGCDYVQGYLHGRPVAPDALSRQLDAAADWRLAG